jgi:hypothetical protein
MQGDGAYESGSLFRLSLSAVEDFEEIRSCNLVCGTYCTVRSAVYRAIEQYSTVLYVQFEWALPSSRGASGFQAIRFISHNF